MSLTTTKIESLWKTFEAINELIRFADTKATAILAINGVTAGFFFSNIELVQTVLKQSPIALVPLLVAIGLVLVSAGSSACCILPRLGNRSECLIFFCDVARNYKSATDYENAWKSATRAKIETELTHQIWANSRIAAEKYDLVWCSVLFFVAALFAIMAITLAVIWR